MQITQKDNFILIGVPLETPLNQLIEQLHALVQSSYSDSNWAIDLTSYHPISASDLEKFLPLAAIQKENKKSFVIINTSVAIDDLPEDLNVVPTVIEAGDLIEMEEIERDLGF
jgi:hypothetical protein